MPADAPADAPTDGPSRSAHTVAAGGFPDWIEQFLTILRDGGDVIEAATRFGARYATHGEGLDVCLSDLDEAVLTIRGEGVAPDVVRATSLAWAEATQTRYNSLTCVDPFTGLASLQHAQAQLAGIYGAAARGELTEPDIADSRTVVVVELPLARPRGGTRFGALENSLRTAAAAELIREMLPEADQPAQLTLHRIGAMVRRSDSLHERLAQLAHRLDARLALSPTGGRCLVWTEALPSTYSAARHLLDELAR